MSRPTESIFTDFNVGGAGVPFCRNSGLLSPRMKGRTLLVDGDQVVPGSGLSAWFSTRTRSLIRTGRLKNLLGNHLNPPIVPTYHIPRR